MNNRECCRTCVWFMPVDNITSEGQAPEEYWCGNPISGYYGDSMLPDGCCEDWEEE